MAYFKISKSKLRGLIPISGAKNAALKILPAAILTDSPSVITNVPDILDIRKMIEILESIGVKIKFENNTVSIDPSAIKSCEPAEQLVKKLRGSIVLVGPLLAKFGRAIFSQPGGCLIGARSIDDHLDVFSQFGIKAVYKNEKFHLSGRPKAGTIVLQKMSVTATENAMMMAVLSKGETKIYLAAAEPEIIDLANFLNRMGAKISGAGTHEISITGVEKINGTSHEIMPDRIEAGTYLIAALATDSEVTIGPVIPEHLTIVLKRLSDAGAKIEIFEKSGQKYFKTRRHHKLRAINTDTRPYPGFPTDLQSPYAVLMTQAEGESHIYETMYEGRFGYLKELDSMHAKITILNPHELLVNGPTTLVGSDISSKDIRGGAALVIAGLIAEGTTWIEDIEFIDRGYENIEVKLRNAGANIERHQTKP